MYQLSKHFYYVPIQCDDIPIFTSPLFKFGILDAGSVPTTSQLVGRPIEHSDEPGGFCNELFPSTCARGNVIQKKFCRMTFPLWL